MMVTDLLRIGACIVDNRRISLLRASQVVHEERFLPKILRDRIVILLLQGE